MNKLSTTERAAVIRCLVEGNSIRATVRMTGVAKNTIAKLLADLGAACAIFQDLAIRNVSAKRIEADEIWSFCYAKEKNLPPEKKGTFGFGDVWTWTAIDAESKLVISWLVGGRDGASARCFMHDLASRLANRVQLTSDGLWLYPEAVREAFGENVDYAQLVKQYGAPAERMGQARYSPAICLGALKSPVIGDPDAAAICTSFVERQNLTMRMGMRRFTRLTNGHSKKLANHMAAISLHFMHYNFGRAHQTLKGRTPAMAAGIADHVWTVEEIVGLLEAQPSN